MSYRTDCYIVDRNYKEDKERIKKAFNVLLKAKVEENEAYKKTDK